MIPDFSYPAFAFLAVCSIRFKAAAAGIGTLGPFLSDYRCQLRYRDEPEGAWGVDARVYFIGQAAANPGDEVAVVLAFLDWERERARCHVGGQFELREGANTTATGVVMAIASRGN